MEIEARDWRERIDLRAVLALFVVVCVAPFVEWCEVRDALKNGHYSGWAGAAASFAAAIAAVWAAFVALRIARQQIAKQNDDAFAKATLVAARVSVVVGEVVLELDSVRAALAFLNAGELYERGPTLMDQIVRCNTKLKTINFTEQEGLIPLPGKVAQRLARAMAVYASLSTLVESHQRRGTWSRPEDEAGQKKLFDQWPAKLSEAYDLLNVVLRGLVAAAAIGAPDPTHEEVYGDSD